MREKFCCTVYTNATGHDSCRAVIDIYSLTCVPDVLAATMQVDEVKVFEIFGGDLPASIRADELSWKTFGRLGGQQAGRIVREERMKSVLFGMLLYLKQ